MFKKYPQKEFTFKTILKNTAGLTIIELLISIFVVSVGLMAVLEFFPLGVKIQKSAQMGTTALLLCQGKMEEVISQSYSEIVPGVYDDPYGFDSEFKSYRRETDISYFDPNNPDITPTDDLGIKKVEVKVFWRPLLGFNEKEVKLATLIAEK